MRDNRKDRTIERNYTQKWRFLIAEYELVKAEKRPKFRFAQDFYAFHGVNRQTFSTCCGAEALERARGGARRSVELKEELALYLLYYNTERPHQGLGGKTPLQAL